MEDLKTKAAEFKDHISEYIKTYIDLIKAKASKGASNVVAGVMIGVVLIFFFLLFLIFGFAALAWWLSGVLHSTPLGFLCVAGFFLLLIIITLLLGKKIAGGIRNVIIRKIYE